MNSPSRTDIMQRLLQQMGSMSRLAVGRMARPAPADMPTHAQLGVMFVLMHNKAQSIKELALQFGISSSAATQLVNSMVEEGLLTRTEDKEDRRSVHIDLTPKGKTKLAAAKNARMKLMAKMFEPLSDQELAQFLKLQQKMLSHLKPND